MGTPPEVNKIQWKTYLGPTSNICEVVSAKSKNPSLTKALKGVNLNISLYIGVNKKIPWS